MECSASVAVEKPNKRLRSGRNGRILGALSRVSEVALISLFLLSYHSSGVSASVELAGEILRRLAFLSSKPLPVFLVGNAIILAVAVLSGVEIGGPRVGDGKIGRSCGSMADDIYEEYIARRRVISAGGNPVCDRGGKNSPPPKVKEAKKSADAASPRGRGSLVAVRDDGSKTVEDMSNEEFNRSVEKYIAKIRRFLQEESTREIEFEALILSAGNPWTEHLRSF